MRKIVILMLCVAPSLFVACGGGGAVTPPPASPATDITGDYILVGKSAVDWVPGSGNDCAYFADSKYQPYHGTMTITNQGFDLEQCFIDRPNGWTTEQCTTHDGHYSAVDDPGILFSWGLYPTDPMFVYPYLDGEIWPLYYTYDQDPAGMFLTIWTGLALPNNYHDWCVHYTIWEKNSD